VLSKRVKMAFGLAVILVAGACSTSPGTSSSKPPGVAAASSLPVLETTLGQVFLDKPLVGASVRLYRPDGSLISPQGAYDQTTVDDGIFLLHPKHLPADFTIVASGGTHGGAAFSGDVRALVGHHAADDADLGVNAATTLVAAYHDRHKDQAIDDITTRVKEGLGIGALGDIGIGLALTDYPFSGATFLDAADASGGFNVFINTLVVDLESKLVLPNFDPPPDAAALAQEAGAASTAATMLKVASALAAFSKCAAGGSQVYGCVVSAMSGGTSEILASLSAIHQTLALIVEQLAALAGQLSELKIILLQAEWNRVVLALLTNYSAQAESGFNALVNASNTALLETTRAHWAGQVALFAGLLHEKAAPVGVSGLLLGAGGISKPMTTFSNLLWEESKRTEANSRRTGFFRNSTYFTSAGVNNDIEGADALRIQQAWQYLNIDQKRVEYLEDFWANSQAALLPEAVKQNYVYPYVGPSEKADSASTINCPAPPVTLADCRGWLQQENLLVPRPLPTYTAIDTKTGLMWFLVLTPQKGYGLPHVACVANTWVDNGTTPDCRTPSTATTANGDPSSAFRDWRTPSRSELGALVNSAPNPQNAGPWLSAAVGFVGQGGLSIQKLSDPVFWTNRGVGFIQRGATVQDPSYRIYGGNNYVVDLNNGQHGQRPTADDSMTTWTISVRTPAKCEFYHGSPPC
jgi:hypothetical protein